MPDIPFPLSISEREDTMLDKVRLCTLGYLLFKDGAGWPLFSTYMITPLSRWRGKGAWCYYPVIQLGVSGHNAEKGKVMHPLLPVI